MRFPRTRISDAFHAEGQAWSVPLFLILVYWARTICLIFLLYSQTYNQENLTVKLEQRGSS